MIAAPTTHQPAPSIQKYGEIILADGFTQHPRAVADYLNTIDICPTAKILLFTLISYRWQAEQEFFPSVRTLAERCGVSVRRINQLTAKLVKLGLIIKSERFAGRSQLSNYYDLEPLFLKVAAWKDAEVAVAMEEEETMADEPFEPQDILEQAAQIVSEEFGEPEPRQIRYNAKRLGRRFDQNPHMEWSDFLTTIEKATKQTEERRNEPTRTGKAFVKLVPYFFSALDYWLSRQKPEPAAQPTQPAQTVTTKPQTSQSQGKGPQQQPKKSGVLAERAAARKAAEAAGSEKVRAPETLKLHIEAAALTFRDKQVKSSVQRAANLMHDAMLDEQIMLGFVAEAREEASRQCNVRARMPYFFSILEEKISSTI